MKKQTDKDSPKTTNVFQTLFNMIRTGEINSSEWFVRNWPKVFAVAFTIFIYITCRFNYSSTMEGIITARQQLKAVHAEEVRQRALYNSSICETSMQQLVDSLHLNLTVQTQPPFILE